MARIVKCDLTGQDVNETEGYSLNLVAHKNGKRGAGAILSRLDIAPSIVDAMQNGKGSLSVVWTPVKAEKTA
ncbi:MAG: hypothetical protein KGI08_08835 [Thaumarchaeota archaeon]|nr:hypothetical protein [Nitrososphaerota archaeon]